MTKQECFREIALVSQKTIENLMSSILNGITGRLVLCHTEVAARSKQNRGWINNRLETESNGAGSEVGSSTQGHAVGRSSVLRL